MRADVDSTRARAGPAAAVPDEGRLGLTRAPDTGETQQPPPSATALRAS